MMGSTTESVASSIIVAIKKSHPYQYGKQITIKTVHGSLNWLLSTK